MLAGSFPLVFGPFDVGAVRLSGVSLTWWYVGVVAPVAAATVTALALFGEPSAGALGRLAAWTSPVLFGAVVARVFAGDPGGPLLVLSALVAPLVALLAERGRRPRGPLAGLAWVVAIGLALWANIALLVDAARPLGVERWQAVLITAPVVALPPLAPWVARQRAALMAIALGVLVAALGVIGARLGASPWAAWAEVASRPALVFGDGSPWVTEGKRVAAATTLSFSEAHRVTAAGPGVYRVLERDGATSWDSLAARAGAGAPGRAESRTAGQSQARPVAREWRLAPGDALTLRPGDQLVLEAGAYVRFESGKRVPGAAMSGVLWADPPQRRSVGSMLEALGVTVTLLGGAVALVGARGHSTRRDVPIALGGALAFALVAAAWGVYAVRGAPDLALGAPALQMLLATPAALAPRPWHGVLIAMTVGALALLAVGAAAGLRDRLDQVLEADRRYSSAVWVMLAAAAAVATLWPADVWRVLLTGLGFAGTVGVAPLLARGDRTSRLAGAFVGGTAFSALALAAPGLPGWAAPFGSAPALVAAPLAWVAVAIAARVAATRRG